MPRCFTLKRKKQNDMGRTRLSLYTGNQTMVVSTMIEDGPSKRPAVAIQCTVCFIDEIKKRIK